MDQHRILVVDDEETLCEALRFNLEEAGYSVDTALSAEEALAMNLEQYSLILLDIMMEGVSGTDMARILKMKPSTARIPIIFCTARDSEEDMVAGLDLGADDYISKPYSVRNVLARVRSVLRRSAHSAAPHSDVAAKEAPGEAPLRFEGLEVLPVRKVCLVDGQEVKMPRKEYEILQLMLRNPGRIYTRAELLKQVWPDEVVVLDRVVDVNITRLRSKIGPYGRHIVTRPGYGYGFIE